MNNYEINEDTLAIIGSKSNKSIVLEGDKEYLVNKRAYEILDESCQYFGSSYQGRVKGTQNMLNSKYKLPIIVEESQKLIFFPTESPDVEECKWISLSNIKNIHNLGDKTKIEFKNNKNLIIDISYYTIKNQLLRSTQLNYVFNNRKNN